MKCGGEKGYGPSTQNNRENVLWTVAKGVGR